MNLFLNFSKGAIALFIIAAALVSCKKERSEPTAPQKNVASNARLVEGVPHRNYDNSIVVKLGENQVKEILRNGETREGHVAVYVTCYINPFSNGTETINRIVILKSESGVDYFVMKAAATTKMMSSRRAEVAFATVISPDERILPNLRVGFDYDSKINIYENFRLFNYPNRDYFDYKEKFSFKVGKAYFSTDRFGRVQYSRY